MIEKLIGKLENGIPLRESEVKAIIHLLKDYLSLIKRLEGRWDEVKNERDI